MKKTKPKTGSVEEPIGIVISRGARPDEKPAVFAYVWGPAPEIAEPARDSKIA
jgi:hypothetical protein